jgi:hypothetical protein
MDGTARIGNGKNRGQGSILDKRLACEALVDGERGQRESANSPRHDFAACPAKRLETLPRICQELNPDPKTAMQYLSRTSVGRETLRQGEHLDIPIVPNNNRRTNVPDVGRTRINWDPRSGIKTTEGGLQSPAIQVLHEMLHAIRRETDRKGYEQDRRPRSDRQYDNREDRRVIEGTNPAAKQLGEAERSNHRGWTTRTDSPIHRREVESDSNSSNTTRTTNTVNTSSAPSASEVDAAHQATGVPSIGAETINFGSGNR